ncbi:MAG: glycosyltransferase 87 family protein [Streptosporangiaceae bacterium]
MSAAPRVLDGTAALTAVNLACVTFFLLSYSRHGVGFGPYRIDLDVYRIGGQVWRRGGDLYGRLPPTKAGVRLPFTYPPIAAVLLSPLSLAPFTVAATVLTLVTIALVAVVLRVFLRRLGEPAGRSGWALAWLLPPALFLEPVRNTLAFGQVNVILMALVSADCLLAAPRWPRGVLVGRLRDGSSVVASAGAGPGTALGSLGAGRGKRLRGFRRARPAAVRIRAAHPPRGRRRPAAP